MIISFTFENWMSYRDKTSFSMIASRERQHGHRVPRVPKYQTRILPIGAIYGGNASGKSNFVKALRFVQDLVVTGTLPDGIIPVQPYLLDNRVTGQPSNFSFELLIDEIIYEFSFTVTGEAVLEEKLVIITSTNERILYHRKNGETNFHDSLKETEFLQFAFQGTRDNQLFLTNSVSQNVKNFRPVYNWFRYNLTLITPDSRFLSFAQFANEENPYYNTHINEMLSQLDTGIAQLGTEEVSIDDTPILKALKANLLESLPENGIATLGSYSGSERYVIARKDGQISAKKLVSHHLMADGTTTTFQISQESDGTRRIMDLLPAFFDASTNRSNMVYIIDEFDRSLHTLLARKLLEAYLAGCTNESRAQLILTTHDVLLMDQGLLRRDEMWVTERDNTDATSMISFSDYKRIRYDKDIRKSYLQGRLGGIPNLLWEGSLSNPCFAEKNEEDI